MVQKLVNWLQFYLEFFKVTLMASSYIEKNQIKLKISMILQMTYLGSAEPVSVIIAHARFENSLEGNYNLEFGFSSFDF